MSAEPETVAAFWRAPFASGRPKVVRMKPGVTLAEMVEAMPDLRPEQVRGGTAFLTDVSGRATEVPFEIWPRVKPKAGVRVTLHSPLHGGGGGGGAQGGGGQGKGRSIGALVAAVALLVVSTIIAGPFGATTLGLGLTGAKILAGAVLLAGNLAIAALTAPPSRAAIAAPEQARETERGPASATGNVLQPGGPIPRVCGTRRIFPPFACQPLVELDSEGNERVEVVAALAGPHALNDIRLGAAAIEQSEDVEFETREGWPGDTPITLVERCGVTTTPQIELSVHRVQDAAPDTLVDTILPANSLPIWHAASSRAAPDEIWLHFQLPGGLYDPASPATKLRLPVRVRIRRRGDADWVHLPELHIEEASQIGLRRGIRLKWGEAPAKTSPASRGWVAAFKSVPRQGIAPFGQGWDAHSHFSAGSGSDHYDASNIGPSNVANATLSEAEACFYLSEATFPKGLYDVEVLRGHPFNASSFAGSTYQYSSVVRDFFGYQQESGANKLARTRNGLSDRLYLNRIASVWNEHPIGESGLALVALRAKNRSVEQLSALASGYVKDWNGSAWADWVTTSNPAPHFRHALEAAYTARNHTVALIDDARIAEWRARCAADGLVCNAIFDGDATWEACTILASCGYARLSDANVTSVFEDYDRADEPPRAVLAPHNCGPLTIEKAFAVVPDGFRVRFPDIEKDYEQNEIIVFRPGRENGSLLEQVTYEGLVDEADARARALFDLQQATERNAFYQVQMSAEALSFQRGDLVLLTSDILSSNTAHGRLSQVERDSAGAVVALYLDGEARIQNRGDWSSISDMSAETDLSSVGRQTAITFANRYGEPVGPLALVGMDRETRRLELVEPLDDPDGLIVPDRVAMVGPVEAVNRRCVVLSVVHGKDLTATVTLVDEAPQLWS